MWWLWLILVLIVILVIVGILYWFLFYKSYNPCKNLGPTWDHSASCLYVSESYLDSTLKTPTAPLYLGAFVYNNTNSSPFCQNTWYAYRAVREQDGGYSGMSPWFGPIQTGSNNNPCVPPSTSQFNPSNPGQYCAQDGIKPTFNANQPTVVTIDPLDYNIQQGIYYNVHRMVSDTIPSSSDTGTIVGYLITEPGSNRQWTSYIVDGSVPISTGGGYCS